MPLELSWSIAGHLIADGFLIGLGWILINAIYDAALWVLGKRRTPQP